MAQQNTLIATFNDYNTAVSAARELEQNGVAASSIKVDSNRKTTGAGSGASYEDTHHEGGFSAWWHSLFGSDHEDRTAYEGALNSGRTILRATVAADTTDRMVDLLNRYGAADVETQNAGQTGNYYSGTDATNTPMNRSRGGVRVYSHEAGQMGSLDRTETRSSARDVRATGLSPNSPAPGVLSGSGTTAGAGTLAGEGTARSRDRELSSDYSRQFEHTFGSDTDTMSETSPAYQYGSRTAADRRYSGKYWSEIENDLRTDYERTNPGSAWDTVKTDVRAGWEKMTGRR